VRTHVLVVLHLKLIILFDVYTITPKRRINKPFLSENTVVELPTAILNKQRGRDIFT
jgi:hypothetical protein